jgi:hypothetical protein
MHCVCCEMDVKTEREAAAATASSPPRDTHTSLSHAVSASPMKSAVQTPGTSLLGGLGAGRLSGLAPSAVSVSQRALAPAASPAKV